ncbi:Biotin protein ligase C terminal domain [Popillia japonica]|uniref:Biotin protein ligase C terminal domain n=1 Tax=Popillia japonica TaxID=7064 RepID=A0AAW1MMS7_POPJA
MYSTFLQWWRLGTLKNKLRGTLNGKNALLVCSGNTISEPDHQRSLENLLFQNEDRIACTIVPRQIINLTQWLRFPKDQAQFPIYIGPSKTILNSPKMYLLIRTNLEHYQPHQAEIIEIEKFGELYAWRINNFFEIILKTDFENVTKLVHCLANSNVDINHELKLLKMEIVDVEGNLMKIKYDRVFPLEQKLKYSCADVHWSGFVNSLKEIYSKIHDVTLNPKITIENGTRSEESKKVPVSEVKPIKKETRKKEPIKKETRKKDADVVEDKKDTLDVHQKKTKDPRSKTKESRSSKGQQHKTAKDPELKSKDDRKHSKDDKHKQHQSSKGQQHKTAKDPELKSKDDRKHSKDDKHKQHHKSKDESDGIKNKDAKTSSRTRDDVKTKDKRKVSDLNPSTTNGESSKTRNDVEDALLSNNLRSKDLNNIKETTSKLLESLKNDATQEVTKPEEFIKLDQLNEGISQEPATVQAQDLLTPSSSNQIQATKQTSAFESQTDNAKSKEQFKSETGDIILEKNIKFSEVKRGLRKSSKSTKNTKPPNVLVYADSLATKENVKDVLTKILNNEKYTIYDLPLNKSNAFWDESTTLVVVCGSVTPNLTTDLLQYLVNGGQLLCLCSDLLYVILQTFSTAEVREHELVRFSYGEWKGVKMMHHIFCYQPSPANGKQFSKDSDQSNHSGGESSPIAPRTPSVVDIQHNGKTYTIQVQVLGAEETWQTPSLLLANVKNSSGGKAIFSQVHLEVDPSQYQDDENVYAALQGSNSARLGILKNLLSSHLDMDCMNRTEEVTFSLGYLLGRHDMKLQMLKDNENIIENKLMGDKLSLIFCGKDDEPGPITSSRLPVMILSCPANFSTVQYFETLETEQIGRLVIYSDVMTSSQDVLSHNLINGLAVIPRQQTKGLGRSGNVWLSPVGCAMFSLQLHVPIQSTLGRSLSLIQHIVMVSIVSAIRNLPGHQELEIGIKWPNDLYAYSRIKIKWPNDLYAYSRIKIGGLIVNSQINNDVAIVNIGVGMNLDNANPTLSLNDIIGKFNVDNGTTLAAIAYEKYFALVFNELERILKTIEKQDMTYFYTLYYKYWLHSGSEISVTTADNQVRKVQIVGIDNYGYLTVKSPDGTVSAVQPDGNTFDMLKGLIAPKIN